MASYKKIIISDEQERAKELNSLKTESILKIYFALLNTVLLFYII